MTRSPLYTAAALALSGCASTSSPPPAPVTPTRLEVSTTPATLLRTAAAELWREGFLVTADTIAHRLRAVRERAPGDPDASVRCIPAENAREKAARAHALIIDLAITPLPGGAGSEATLTSRVRASYLRLGPEPRRPDSDRACSSTGAAEQAVVTALGSKTAAR